MNKKWISIIMLFSVNLAFADSYYHHKFEYSEPEIRTMENKITEGVASAIAISQHHFDWGTKSWQGSVGIGAFDSKTAFSFGLAKRFNKTLISGTVSEEQGKYGGGIGIGFHF